jgi:hypothetical protein
MVSPWSRSARSSAAITAGSYDRHNSGPPARDQ